MGLGLAQFIPFIVYGVSFVIILLTVFYRPIIGVFFLFPLLPYQNIFENIKGLPLGKDINDVIFFCIVLSMFFHHKSDDDGIPKSASFDKTDMQFPVLIFVLSSFISVVISTVKNGFSFDLENNFLIAWKNYMLLPMAFMLTYKIIRTEKSLKRMLLLLIIGIFGVAFYFYREMKSFDFSHFSWGLKDRMTGLFVYLGPNHYGAFFTHFGFVLLGIFLFEKTPARKWSLLGIILLLVNSLIRTLSRGSYVAFLAGLLILGILKSRIILLILVVFLIFWRALVPNAVVERIETTRTSSGELDPSSQERIELWKVGMDMFKSSPIVGCGFNSFEARGFVDTHNFYVKMLAESGIVGLLSFLYLLFASLRSGWDLYRKAHNDLYKGLGLGFAVCVISVMITNIFGNRWSYLSLGSYFWIFLALVSRARNLNALNMRSEA